MKHYYKDPESTNLGRITNFNTIAWPDLTFPKEHFIDNNDSSTENINDQNQLIYPAYKYKSPTPPLCIFLPSEQLMLKIMRSCLGIRDKADLVFNWKIEE